MSKHASATFDINSWDEKPYDEQKGAKLARARVSKTFRGDIEGESITELLLAYVQGAGRPTLASSGSSAASLAARAASSCTIASPVIVRSRNR